MIALRYECHDHYADILEVGEALERARQAEQRASLLEQKVESLRQQLADANGRVDRANATIRAANEALAGARRQVAESRRDQRDSRGYLKVLGLDLDVFGGLTEDEIQARLKANFRLSALKAHPDRGGNNDRMRQVNEANEVLSDPVLRKAYMTRTGKFTPKQ